MLQDDGDLISSPAAASGHEMTRIPQRKDPPAHRVAVPGAAGMDDGTFGSRDPFGREDRASVEAASIEIREEEVAQVRCARGEKCRRHTSRNKRQPLAGR